MILPAEPFPQFCFFPVKFVFKTACFSEPVIGELPW
jgi:hypothetical protein